MYRTSPWSDQLPHQQQKGMLPFLYLGYQIDFSLTSCSNSKKGRLFGNTELIFASLEITSVFYQTPTINSSFTCQHHIQCCLLIHTYNLQSYLYDDTCPIIQCAMTLKNNFFLLAYVIHNVKVVLQRLSQEGNSPDEGLTERPLPPPSDQPLLPRTVHRWTEMLGSSPRPPHRIYFCCPSQNKLACFSEWN